jgi:hypothetical protein
MARGPPCRCVRYEPVAWPRNRWTEDLRTRITQKAEESISPAPWHRLGGAQMAVAEWNACASRKDDFANVKMFAPAARGRSEPICG